MSHKVHKARLALAEKVLTEARSRVAFSRRKPTLRTNLKVKNPPEPPKRNRLNISKSARDALEGARGSTFLRKLSGLENEGPLAKDAESAEAEDWESATNMLAKEFKRKPKP